jgi:hypothetical protein
VDLLPGQPNVVRAFLHEDLKDLPGLVKVLVPLGVQ